MKSFEVLAQAKQKLKTTLSYIISVRTFIFCHLLFRPFRFLVFFFRVKYQQSCVYDEDNTFPSFLDVVDIEQTRHQVSKQF